MPIKIGQIAALNLFVGIPFQHNFRSSTIFRDSEESRADNRSERDAGDTMLFWLDVEELIEDSDALRSLVLFSTVHKSSSDICSFTWTFGGFNTEKKSNKDDGSSSSLVILAGTNFGEVHIFVS
eukprot:NODE_10_length_47437_cov_0.363429.p28 type:complete len:124 gc:universal NODE_10_length_47437_cov_0.363429:21739-22110(+)